MKHIPPSLNMGVKVHEHVPMCWEQHLSTSKLHTLKIKIGVGCGGGGGYRVSQSTYKKCI